MKHKRNIVVTGGAGYIGSVCVPLLLEEGHNVSVIDNLSHGSREAVPGEAHFFELDVRDEEALVKIFESAQCETVIHLAALKSIEEAQREPELYIHNNVDGTHHVLSAMARTNTTHVIFSSSAAVYGDGGEVAYTEEMPILPSNIYGETKLLAEQLIHSYVHAGSITSATILRFFNVAGASGLPPTDMHPESLFDAIASRCVKGLPITVYGDDYATPDGTCVRDYIHVSDIARIHARICDERPHGVFNLGSGTGVSVNDVIRAFETVLGKPISVETHARRDGDVPFSCADATKAQVQLGWSPQETLETMARSSLLKYGHA